MRKFFPAVASATVALVLASCGGGGDDSKFMDPGGGPNGSTPGVTVSLGSPSGSAFSAGAMQMSTGSLSAGGSASMQVVLQQSDGTLYTQSTDISFNSTCSALSRATMDSPVTTANGIASTTYVAKGCSGDDVVTATAIVGGKQITASGTIKVATAAIGSIQFEGATPKNIALKGTGGGGRPETSTVVFRVVDASGGPRADADVTFTLDTTVGGINLSAATAKSDAAGRVQTVVNAGTVSTSVRVTARITSPQLSTQSNQLTITTGIPDSDSVSLAVQCPNVEAFDIDGVVVPVTARLSDRFNNPVPDGTSIAFKAEGGQIVGQCNTGDKVSGSGACTVDWTSSNPRPMTPAGGVGRVTLLATAIGEDSFTDKNGNGFYDTGEAFADGGEPYSDDNEDKAYTPGEFFLDFDNSGSRSAGDSAFSGVICNGSAPGSTCNLTTTAIGGSNLIIMSTSEAEIHGPTDQTITHGGASVDLKYTVADLNGNPLAKGSTIKAEITTGAGTLGGVTTYTVPCTSAHGAAEYSFSLTPPSGAGPKGTVTITVTSAGGLISSPFRTNITVN